MTHDPRYCFPVMPRCSHWPTSRRDDRCPNKATGVLCSPDGLPVPGSCVCDEHGRAVVKEFQKKIREAWAMRPIHRYDSNVCADIQA